MELSDGPGRRIALARVVREHAQVLVLDEAATSLDSEVEAANPRAASRA